MRSRLPAFVMAAGLALTGAMVSTTSASASTGVSAAAHRPVAADDGAYVVSENWIDARTVDLTIDSPAVGAAEPVRLLLPPDWNNRPHKHWPVLYLLHGCCGHYTSWSGTDIKALSANTDVLVVMPEAGADGFYTNWWNGGADGTPAWETFHLTELRQILDRGFRAGDKMAVAGLSMGGYGAMKYAETGLFRAAASFSGVVDPLNSPTGPLKFLYPNALWGDPVAQRDIWVKNDPTYHVDKLRGVNLFVASGNGQAGPLDPPSSTIDPVEAEVHAESLNFVAALQQARIPVTTDFYGAGKHAWPYWQRDLNTAFPMLMQSIGAEPASTP